MHQYDWSKADALIAQVKAAGFTHIAFDIVASSFDTPQWLKDSLPADQKILFLDDADQHKTFCQLIETVLYWNPTFHEGRLALIQAAGARYASDDAIVAVWASFVNQNSGDWHPQDTVGTVHCPPAPPCVPGPIQQCGDVTVDQVQQWLDAGWQEETMLQVGKEIAQEVAIAWPRQNIKLPVGGLADALAQDTPLENGYSRTAREMVDWVYGRRHAGEPRPGFQGPLLHLAQRCDRDLAPGDRL